MDWMLLLWIFLLLVGLALLVKGADWFVDGGAGIAHKAKIPPLIIGLTVMAFGTSVPELAVSVTGAAQHSTDICVGNVLGSNVANILLILGVAALITKLPVHRESFRLDLPVLLFSSALFVVLGIAGNAVYGEESAIRWWSGLILILVLAAYMTVLFVKAHRRLKEERTLPVTPAEAPQEEPVKEKGKFGKWFDSMKEKLWFCILLTVAGLGMVVGGGVLFVDGAKYIAVGLGASDRLIGLTVVAIGTSLPELVTSVVAATKKETDIAVGNIIGSNIFNILLIAGVSSLVYPLRFTMGENLVDACVALGAALLLFVFSFFDRRRLGVPAGVVFLSFYVGYYVYLFLSQFGVIAF